MTLGSVSVNFQLTSKDLFQVRLGNILRKWHLYASAAIFFLMCAWVIEGTPMDLSDMASTLFLFLVLVIGYFGVLYFGVYFSSRSQFKSSKSMQQPIICIISMTGFDVSSATSQSHTDWPNIFRASETESFFLLWPSKAIFWMIPKRSIPEEAGLQTIREIIRENVKGKINLRK